MVSAASLGIIGGQRIRAKGDVRFTILVINDIPIKLDKNGRRILRKELENNQIATMGFLQTRIKSEILDVITGQDFRQGGFSTIDSVNIRRPGADFGFVASLKPTTHGILMAAEFRLRGTNLTSPELGFRSSRNPDIISQFRIFAKQRANKGSASISAKDLLRRSVESGVHKFPLRFLFPGGSRNLGKTFSVRGKTYTRDDKFPYMVLGPGYQPFNKWYSRAVGSGTAFFLNGVHNALLKATNQIQNQ